MIYGSNLSESMTKIKSLLEQVKYQEQFQEDFNLYEELKLLRSINIDEILITKIKAQLVDEFSTKYSAIARYKYLKSLNTQYRHRKENTVEDESEKVEGVELS